MGRVRRKEERPRKEEIEKAEKGTKRRGEGRERRITNEKGRKERKGIEVVAKHKHTKKCFCKMKTNKN